MIATNTCRSKNIKEFKLVQYGKVPYELKKIVPKFINLQ